MNELRTPEPEAITYFGRPLLKKPHWEWNVISYLFLGGVMGGTGLIAALAQQSEDKALERNARYLSVPLAMACPALLIGHLGRPERFLNMMRIVKFKSAMSLGVWGLVGYSGFATLNAAAHLMGGKANPVSSAMQALFGGFIMTYTGVLLSATAIPIWGKGKYHIPAMSVASALSGACALNSIALSLNGDRGAAQHKLEKLEAFSAVAELAILLHFRTYAGETGKPMYEGKRGERLRSWTIGAGIVAPLLLNLPSMLSRKNSKRPSFFRTLAAGALTLAGGYILRETLIESGKASADDPKEAFVQPT